MAIVSYGLKITEAYHIFDKTIKTYHNAVHYIQPKTRMYYGCIIGLMKSYHKGYMITPSKMDLHDTPARKFFRAFLSSKSCP